MRRVRSPSAAAAREGEHGMKLTAVLGRSRRGWGRPFPSATGVVVIAALVPFTSTVWANFGACCDDETNICTNEDQPVCEEAGLRFGGVGSDCADLDPPCGCTPLDCDDGLTCTIDECDPNGDVCVHTPDDNLCDNGLDCDGLEFCDPIKDCQPGDPIDCTHLDDQCIIGECDESTLECETAPVGDDEPCDDGLFCTVDEVCMGGSCGDGVERDCDNGIDCTIDSCDEDADTCVHVPDDSYCQNEFFCDGAEVCDLSLGCQPGDPIDCTPMDSDCNVGVCDEELDACVEEPTNENGPCEDGLFCTVGEICISGVCEGGVERDCDDGNECTFDACNDESDTCMSEALPAGEPCGNDTPEGDCDNADVCDGDGNCVPNTEPPTTICREAIDECDAEEFCTGDSADCPDDDVLPSDTPCTDDDDPCTADVCDGLSIVCTHQDNDLCGACCDRTPDRGGVCTDDVLEGDCIGGDNEKLVWNRGLTCAGIDCSEADGACCEAVDGTCVDGLLSSECTGTNEEWNQDESCSAVTCNLAVGACCDPDVMALRGVCTDALTRAECLSCESGKCTWFKADTCAQVHAMDGCISNPIPTVSEWGLVIMTLLLLTGAKIYFGYRPELG